MKYLFPSQIAGSMGPQTSVCINSRQRLALLRVSVCAVLTCFALRQISQNSSKFSISLIGKFIFSDIFTSFFILFDFKCPSLQCHSSLFFFLLFAKYDLVWSFCNTISYKPFLFFVPLSYMFPFFLINTSFLVNTTSPP